MKAKDSKEIIGSLMLLITAIIWGFAFVAQQVGGAVCGPFTFNAVRFVIGGLVLLPLLLIQKRTITKEALIGGILCGICLFAGSALQQIGLQSSTAGKAGFITALYVILVPLTGLFLGKRIPGRNWFCAILALIGLFLLCVSSDFTIQTGDIWLFACAFVFTAHILVIDYYSAKADGVVISCLQFFVAGILSTSFAVPMESTSFREILSSWMPILYTGVLSCGVAYTLQVVFQKNVKPSRASILLSLESVFATTGGWMLLGQAMTWKELLGCVLMFSATILSLVGKKESNF